MQKTLAFVIPAYKADYLERTLSSLAYQSCKDFTLYVGDDASPKDLQSIVERFRDRLNINYVRFEGNLGGKDLVAHWERCLALCRDEEWVCLFSDDDLLEENCVASFKEAEVPDDVDVLHWNLDIIDEDGRPIRRCPDFPAFLSAENFFDQLFRRQIVARMPEFIFRREAIVSSGFVPFDMAWRSDTATVIQLASRGGIMTLPGKRSRVLWRASRSNISGDHSLMERKNRVNVLFFNWINSFFLRQNMKLPMSRLYLLKTIAFALEYRGGSAFLKDGFSAARQLDLASGPYFFAFLLFLPYRLIYRLKEV